MPPPELKVRRSSMVDSVGSGDEYDRARMRARVTENDLDVRILPEKFPDSAQGPWQILFIAIQVGQNFALRPFQAAVNGVGMPAGQSPVLHLRRLSGGRLFDHYMASFERVWQGARPVTEESEGRFVRA